MSEDRRKLRDVRRAAVDFEAALNARDQPRTYFVAAMFKAFVMSNFKQPWSDYRALIAEEFDD